MRLVGRRGGEGRRAGGGGGFGLGSEKTNCWESWMGEAVASVAGIRRSGRSGGVVIRDVALWLEGGRCYFEHPRALN